MAFIPKKYDNGLVRSIALAVSQTILKGDALEWSSGYLAAGAADDEATPYVALEDKTTDGSSHDEILCVPALRSGIRFEVVCTIPPVIAQLGIAYELSTKNILDNEATATANGFVMEEIVDAANKLVIGYWM